MMSAPKFTAKERDAETGLDYFLARYFSGPQGRFTSPDEPFNDQDQADQQSWNLYSYTRNNPLRYVDPTGRCSKAADGYTDEGKGLFPGSCSGGTIGDSNKNKNSTNVNDFEPPSPLLLAVATGAQRAKGPVNAVGIATGVVMAVGVGVGAIAGGTALTSLAIASTPLLPAVPSAIEKLQRIGVSLQQAAQIVASPGSQKLIDTANGNNINVIQQVGDKLVRITLDPAGQRIISAGYVQERNVANSIASGWFIVK